MDKSKIVTGMTGLLVIYLLAPMFFYLGPIPITLQTFVLFSVAALLGKKTGFLLSFVYLASGAAGLPVFAGWQGGYEHLLGRTAGFLWGFPVVCYYIGWQVEKGQHTFIHYIIYFFRAHLLLLIPGAIVAYSNYGSELFQGIVRLMPGMLIKTIAGGLLTFWLIKKLPPRWTEVHLDS